MTCIWVLSWETEKEKKGIRKIHTLLRELPVVDWVWRSEWIRHPSDICKWKHWFSGDWRIERMTRHFYPSTSNHRRCKKKSSYYQTLPDWKLILFCVYLYIFRILEFRKRNAFWISIGKIFKFTYKHRLTWALSTVSNDWFLFPKTHFCRWILVPTCSDLQFIVLIKS